MAVKLAETKNNESVCPAPGTALAVIPPSAVGFLRIPGLGVLWQLFVALTVFRTYLQEYWNSAVGWIPGLDTKSWIAVGRRFNNSWGPTHRNETTQMCDEDFYDGLTWIWTGTGYPICLGTFYPTNWMVGVTVLILVLKWKRSAIVAAAMAGLGYQIFQMVRRTVMEHMSTEEVVDEFRRWAGMQPVSIIVQESKIVGSDIKPKAGACHLSQIGFQVKGVLIGHGWRMDDYMIAPSHVLNDCIEEQTQLLGPKGTISVYTQDLVDQAKEIASDVVAIQLESRCFSVLGSKTARPAPLAASKTVSVKTMDGLSSVGSLQAAEQFGTLVYMGSTQGGFSGTLYTDGERIYGMHMWGNSNGNGGMEALYIKKRLEKHIGKAEESSEDARTVKEIDNWEEMEDGKGLGRTTHGKYYDLASTLVTQLRENQAERAASRLDEWYPGKGSANIGGLNWAAHAEEYNAESVRRTQTTLKAVEGQAMRASESLKGLVEDSKAEMTESMKMFRQTMQLIQDDAKERMLEQQTPLPRVPESGFSGEDQRTLDNVSQLTSARYQASESLTSKGEESKQGEDELVKTYETLSSKQRKDLLSMLKSYKENLQGTSPPIVQQKQN
nr:MAG: hypothetical protein [Solemoviridae sp.]